MVADCQRCLCVLFFLAYSFSTVSGNDLLIVVDAYSGIYYTESDYENNVYFNFTKSNFLDQNFWAIDFNPDTNYIYWSDLGSPSILRAQFKGHTVETVVTNVYSYGLAIDRTNKKLYWTEHAVGTVRKSNLDGTDIITLISENTTTLWGIELDIQNGHMYWADSGKRTIERANMDGKERIILVGSGLRYPTDIALEISENRMYWSEALGNRKISYSDLLGQNRRTLISSIYPYALDIVGSYLYWADRESDSMFRVDRFNPSAIVQVGNTLDSTTGFYIFKREEGPDTIMCPMDITVNVTSGKAYAVNVAWTKPSTIYNSGGIQSPVSDYTAGNNMFAIGNTTVQYNMSDESGNINDGCSFVVTVEDNEDPVISGCPNDTTINSTPGLPTATFSWTEPTAEDNAGNVTLTVDIPSGSTFSLYDTLVTYTAIDSYGNTEVCSFTVTLQDLEDPLITNCPNNIVDVTAPNAMYANVSWFPEPSADDNHQLVSFNQTHYSGDSFNVGITEVRYIVEDLSGNHAECVFNITVIDACKKIVCHNDGVCEAIGMVFRCNCLEFYSGTLCENLPDLPTFSVTPTKIKDNLYSVVNLTCNVSNSNDWQWYKDGIPLVSSKNQKKIMVTITIDNQGYYTCSGYGAGPHSDTPVSSNKVPLVAKDVSVFPTFLTFSEEFDKDLQDPSSLAFQEKSLNITEFLMNGLSLNTSIQIKIRSFTDSLNVNLHFYVLNENIVYEEFLKTLSDELVKIADNSGGYLMTDSVMISSTETCYGGKYGKYTFPNANVGAVVNSTERCDESKVNYLLPLGTRECTGDRFSAAEWDEPVATDCEPDATAEQLLEGLVNMEINVDNVEEVSKMVEEITTKTEEITVEALETTAVVLEKILSVDSNSANVTESVVQVVDNLFDVNEEILMESQMEDQAPTMIIEVLEEQLSLVELDENGVFEEITPNVAVKVEKVDVSQARNITYFSYLSKSTQESVGPVETVAYNEKIPDAANVSIVLPVNELVEKNITDFRVVVVVYNDYHLFQSSQFVKESSKERRPNSQVISMSVPSIELVELKDPVVITFIPFEISEKNENTTCVFWDFDLDGIGGWSSEGCVLVNGSADGSDRQICECNHLTNFAILMDFYPNSPPPPPALDIVTLVGLGISIFCLTLTLLTFVSKRLFRKSTARKLQCQLCISLLGLYIVFLVGIDRKDHKRGCIAVGALLHYFLLSSMFWMCVQAVNMYFLFVKVFATRVSRFFLKACLFAWGLPVAIVSVSLFVDVDSYVESKNHCFLTIKRMYYGVAIPVALALLFNTIIFIRVLHSLRQLGRKSTLPEKIKKKKNNGKQMLQNGSSIALVLGLTWLVGFFAIGDASTVVLWLFCILNSFQGFLIFLMFCVRNKDVREHWRKMVIDLPLSTVTSNQTIGKA